jgi:hypothetical protein
MTNRYLRLFRRAYNTLERWIARRIVARFTRRLSLVQRKKAAGPDRGLGLILTQATRKDARSADEFWREYGVHRKLEEDAQSRLQGDSWLSMRWRNRH